MDKDIILDFRECSQEKIEKFLELIKDKFSNFEVLSSELKFASETTVGINIYSMFFFR